ncbi:MAG: U32 family peptidase [Muribaculaceae bacterium]|nr:U32 family peptidase [Muribaculaceae bacterium]
MTESVRNIELLAPAKDAATAIEAINCGADAIYIGASKYGARYNAANSTENIRLVVNYAHLFNCKVYVTINTIIKDEELEDVRALICELYDIGVDALIVQDMGILMMQIPPIELHASTQCDISSVEKAEFLESVGFSQLVLARELSLEQIREIAQKVRVPVEVFVHGALCVSYSGKCHASQAMMQRSANRGECAQICRLSYDLLDGNNNTIISDKYLLSLKDMNQIDRLYELIEAGVSSFKIEGRLKDIGYVKNVVSAYRAALDRIICDNPDKYVRSSAGVSEISFTPDLNKTFNRGYTHYFLDSSDLGNLRIANHMTPKSMGEIIGVAKHSSGNKVHLSADRELSNGDGLSYFNKTDKYEGIRINKVLSKDIINTLSKSTIPDGAVLYRTYDKKFNDLLSVPSRRFIYINWILTDTFLQANDEIGNSYNYNFDTLFDESQSDQKERQIYILSKLGDTHYKTASCDINTTKFIPASILSQARRACVEGLMKTQLNKAFSKTRNRRNCYKSDYKNSLYLNKYLSFRENIANKLALEFYKNHGVSGVEFALEINNSFISNENLLQIMTTKYCLLRELGACKKMKTNNNYKEPLKMRASDGKILLLNFDCNKCCMNLYIHSQSNK